jgi:hypothetical protein
VSTTFTIVSRVKPRDSLPMRTTPPSPSHDGSYHDCCRLEELLAEGCAGHALAVSGWAISKQQKHGGAGQTLLQSLVLLQDAPVDHSQYGPYNQSATPGRE